MKIAPLTSSIESDSSRVRLQRTGVTTASDWRVPVYVLVTNEAKQGIGSIARRPTNVVRFARKKASHSVFALTKSRETTTRAARGLSGQGCLKGISTAYPRATREADQIHTSKSHKKVTTVSRTGVGEFKYCNDLGKTGTRMLKY